MKLKREESYGKYTIHNYIDNYFDIYEDKGLDELNEALRKGGKVKMIHSTSMGEWMAIAYVVVEI